MRNIIALGQENKYTKFHFEYCISNAARYGQSCDFAVFQSVTVAKDMNGSKRDSACT